MVHPGNAYPQPARRHTANGRGWTQILEIMELHSFRLTAFMQYNLLPFHCRVFKIQDETCFQAGDLQVIQRAHRSSHADRYPARS